jgi:hypothetical protein
MRPESVLRSYQTGQLTNSCLCYEASRRPHRRAVPQGDGDCVGVASDALQGKLQLRHKVLGQKFSSNTHFTPKMAKNGRFQRVDSQQLLVRFSCTFSRLSRITSNRSYLTCNPPSCRFVEMCCCDHEARFGTGNFVWRPIQKVTWQATPTTSPAITQPRRNVKSDAQLLNLSRGLYIDSSS